MVAYAVVADLPTPPSEHPDSVLEMLLTVLAVLAVALFAAVLAVALFAKKEVLYQPRPAMPERMSGGVDYTPLTAASAAVAASTTEGF